jgi:predicted SprT family Zn-dependent metalloprotease
MIHNLIKEMVSDLPILKPYKITLQTSMRKNAALYTAEYNDKGKLVRHNIKINMENIEFDMRRLEDLIAHELIHAWQEENGYSADPPHGPEFAIMAEYVESKWPVQCLYLPDTDNP